MAPPRAASRRRFRGKSAVESGSASWAGRNEGVMRRKTTGKKERRFME
jgi:hypothetical protein